MSTNIKNLEEKLEVKVKAMRVKDDACKEFKVAKANAEKRLNETLLDLEITKCVRKCDLSDFKLYSQTHFKEHVRSHHVTGQRCQTKFKQQIILLL